MSTYIEEILKKAMQQKNEEKPQTTHGLRPTFYLGLGGFGCSVVRKLKQEVLNFLPNEAGGFAFLGLDTHERLVNDILGENEYMALSLGVEPHTVANMQPQYLGWFNELMGAYKAKSIIEGAGKIKAVGRLSFRHQPTFQNFLQRLNNVRGQLTQFRANFSTTKPPKVYVISSMAGGTGAGCLLDVMLVAGKFFREASGDFPYQAVIATPDVLHGEVTPDSLLDFYANSYATLKEIHHFVGSTESLVIDYDGNTFRNVKLDKTLLPSPIHLIGDTNEYGKAVVSRMEELADIAASYLFSEIRTPLEEHTGQPKIQDLENTRIGSQGHSGMPRAFSSFGVVRTGFPMDKVAELFAFRLIHATLAAELHLPTDAHEKSLEWIEANRLKEMGEDQLQDLIKEHTGTDAMKLTLDAAGNLMQSGFEYDQLASDCRNFQQTRERIVAEQKRSLIANVGNNLAASLTNKLEETFKSLFRQKTLGEALSVLQKIDEGLRDHQLAIRQETEAARASRQRLETDVNASIQDVGESAHSFWIGRKRRVYEALSDFDARLETLLKTDVNIWIKEQAEGIYVRLLEKCKSLQDVYQPSADVLAGHLRQSETRIIETGRDLDHLADIGRRGEGNRFSLINAARSHTLYDEEIMPQQTSVVRRLHEICLKEDYFEDHHSNSDEWLSRLVKHIVENELQARFKQLNLLVLLARFYKSEETKRQLFQNLNSLSTPLFQLDPNRAEAGYESYWILAVHPTLKADFMRDYDAHLPGQGKAFASFDLLHEIILYQLKFGYTIHSFKELDKYERAYQRAQRAYRASKVVKAAVPPLHSWQEAENWDDLLPRETIEKAAQWFIAGRAFNYLLSTNENKPESFIYTSGNNYFIKLGEQAPELIGKNLNDAFDNFSEREDWLQALQQQIRYQIKQKGEDALRVRLEKEYLPVLETEIANAEKSANPNDYERALLIRKLNDALTEFIKQELQTRIV